MLSSPPSYRTSLRDACRLAVQLLSLGLSSARSPPDFQSSRNAQIGVSKAFSHTKYNVPCKEKPQVKRFRSSAFVTKARIPLFVHSVNRRVQSEETGAFSYHIHAQKRVTCCSLLLTAEVAPGARVAVSAFAAGVTVAVQPKCRRIYEINLHLKH